jgi:hypothetical protein
MGESKSGSGIPFSLTTVVAVLTCLGGLLLATRTVRSDRPGSPAEMLAPGIGNQNVAARLWEDPLDWKTSQPQAGVSNAFDFLRAQILAHSSGTNRPGLLSVMIHGGPYSEDRESRLRSRFAIISALGESGYVPEDAEHVGAVEIPWPSVMDLNDGRLTNAEGIFYSRTNENNPKNNFSFSDNLQLSFEWYHSRNFNGGGSPSPRYILLLWLDENQFDDEYPLVRLSFLFDQLGINQATSYFQNVSLIGPRSSTTLQKMLPEYAQTNYDQFSPAIGKNMANVLRAVDVFSPTASAMDEALIADSSNAPPRAPVEKILTNFWFRSFHNFSATDAQLAGEALDELRLRQIDLSNPQKNLALISEWDTFYGRMMLLAFAAELEKFQTNYPSDLDFINVYRRDKSAWPANLIPFVYLRGLDGQTTKPVDASDENQDATDSSGDLHSLDNFKHGDPNQIKAQGQTQLDYFSRLGDKMQVIEKNLQRGGRGRLDAIGIVGSDVFDTLVILQILRPRFPDAVFFTTDLDARYSHPTEQEWSRNLIVLSGYGLQLNKSLQHRIAPFRESKQTAQFAATLAALGNANLSALNLVTPRRFEIGRGEAFDLSVNDGGFLQPRAQRKISLSPKDKIAIVAKIVALVALGFWLLSFFWRRVARLTLDAADFEIESLWFREEDIGGRAGVTQILQQIKKLAPHDPYAHWLWNLLQEQNPPLDFSGAEVSAVEVKNFLDFLNNVVLQQNGKIENISESNKLKNKTKLKLRKNKNYNTGIFPTSRMKWQRQALDELFTEILENEKINYAQHARRAGLEQYKLRHRQLIGYWLAGVALAIIFLVFLRSAFNDGFLNPRGEPFYFLAGISIWPTEIIRLIAFALAAFFIINSHVSLRESIFDLTRRFRLSLTPEKNSKLTLRLPGSSRPQTFVDADTLWEQYQQLGKFLPRLARVLPILGIYFLMCFLIMSLGTLPYSPVRGIVAAHWNQILLLASVLSFIFLAFWIVDETSLCRWFIERLSQSPTRHSESSLKFFAKQRGLDEKHVDLTVLSEWIDIQLIAELTARVGKLVYFPFIIFFFLLLARNNWIERWTWPFSLVIIFGLNLTLAAASMIILRNAALKARETSLKNLRAQVAAADQDAAPSPRANQAAVGHRLLNEIESLDTGAFAPIWENPVIGAILIPSGGSVLIELLANLFH